MEGKRELILMAALQQFAQDGYTKATMQSIAKRAGVGKGTTYEYFPSKEALFSEVIHEGLNYTWEQLTEELESTGTVYEKLMRMYDKYFVLYRDQHELKNIILNDFGHIPKQFHDQFQVKQQEMITVLTQLFQSGIDKGELADIDSEIAAGLFLTSLQVVIKQGERKGEPSHTIQHLLTILFEGLGKK